MSVVNISADTAYSRCNALPKAVQINSNVVFIMSIKKLYYLVIIWFLSLICSNFHTDAIIISKEENSSLYLIKVNKKAESICLLTSSHNAQMWDEHWCLWKLLPSWFCLCSKLSHQCILHIFILLFIKFICMHF